MPPQVAIPLPAPAAPLRVALASVVNVNAPAAPPVALKLMFKLSTANALSPYTSADAWPAPRLRAAPASTAANLFLPNFIPISFLRYQNAYSDTEAYHVLSVVRNYSQYMKQTLCHVFFILLKQLLIYRSLRYRFFLILKCKKS